MRIFISILSLSILCFCFLNCSTDEAGSLEGTWQMVSGKYVTPSGIVECNEEARLCYKILGEQHFSVVEMYRANPDSGFFAAVGRYKVDGPEYTEILEGCNNANMVGNSNVFESTLTGNSWRIYRKTEDMELDETWVRVKQVM